ncbi:PD-(D/E)XK nuclease domain-containing protein, partial [Spirosoma terrae]
MVGEARADISQKLNRLKLIKGELPLIDEFVGIETIVEKSFVDVQTEAISQLARIFSRFHKVAQSLRYRRRNRETLVIKDEYDVQDLLNSL